MKNITDKVHAIIDKICTDNRNKTFAYFTVEDIRQEIWIICLKALDGYDPKKGKLEHYLRRSVKNRLYNLKRDKYFKVNPNRQSGKLDTRINLVNAFPLDILNESKTFDIMCSNNDTQNPLSKLLANEMEKYVYDRLAPNETQDLICVLNNNKIKRTKYEALFQSVKRIIEEYKKS